MIKKAQEQLKRMGVKFDPDQARDDHGRFASGGGGAASDKPITNTAQIKDLKTGSSMNWRSTADGTGYKTGGAYASKYYVAARNYSPGNDSIELTHHKFDEKSGKWERTNLGQHPTALEAGRAAGWHAARADVTKR